MEPLFTALEQIARAHDKSIAQVALNWLLASQNQVIPIPGVKNLRQARENLGAVGWRLSNDERTIIDQAETASR